MVGWGTAQLKRRALQDVELAELLAELTSAIVDARILLKPVAGNEKAGPTA